MSYQTVFNLICTLYNYIVSKKNSFKESYINVINKYHYFCIFIANILFILFFYFYTFYFRQDHN